MEVTISSGPHGTILVGRRPAAPAGVGRILLAGVDAYLDPTAPDDPPFAMVHEPDEAAPALAAVHGDRIADAVLDLARVGGEEVSVVDHAPGRLAGQFRTVALAAWLDVYSPDTLPADLVDAEAAVAAEELDGLLTDPATDTARDRLRSRTVDLVGRARRVRDGGPLTTGETATVTSGLRLLYELLSPGDPAFDDVRHEAELAEAVRRFIPSGSMDWSAVERAVGIGDRRVAPAGRDLGRPDADRTDSVDWLQVPRGLLGTGEDTVSWRLSDDGTRLTVSVSALPGAPDTRALAFRLYSSETPLPIAVGSLARDGSVFTGETRVHASASGVLTLDVHDAARPRPPRLGSARDSARATRWAARGLTALRMGVPGGDPAVVAALDVAAVEFGRVALDHPSPAGRAMAARREARCRAVEDVVRARTGTPRPFSDDDPLSGPVTPQDVASPDLDGVGWAPLTAERALSAG